MSDWFNMGNASRLRVYFLLYLSLQADDIENEANELIRIKNYLYGKLAEHTGHSVEKARISDYLNLLSRL